MALPHGAAEPREVGVGVRKAGGASEEHSGSTTLADLPAVLKAWPHLPAEVRERILALIHKRAFEEGGKT